MWMSLQRVGIVLGGLGLVAGLVAGCQNEDPSSSQPPASSSVAKAADSVTATQPAHPVAPSFARPTLSGDSVRLSDWRGNVVVVNFWATWCAPCRDEIPGLITLHDAMHDEGVRIVGVSVDDEGASVVRPYAEAMQITYPLVLAPEIILSLAYGGHYALPTTFVVDREGHIRERLMRAVEPDALRSLIEPLL